MDDLFDDSAMPATAEQVTRDANLIARNLACLGTSAAAATADHIRSFWAPMLRATLSEQARTHPERFSDITRNAIGMLKAPRP